MKNIYENDITKIIEEADQICSGKYVFNNVWDMEPCDDVVDNPDFDWSLRYQDDQEWAYMFTRFDYSYKLIFAYENTGDRKYLDFGIQWFRYWTRHNILFLIPWTERLLARCHRPKGLGNRSLDIAILAANMADFGMYCYEKGIIHKGQFRKIKKAVEIICRRVQSLDGEIKMLTNWGPIENGNILYAMLRLNLKWPHETALARLENELKMQIRSDGSQTESSPMYLAQILLTAFRIIHSFTGILSGESMELIRRACDYIYLTADPDNCIPQIGDSDKINISDLMAVAAKLLDDKKYLTRVNRKVSLEYIYRYQIPLEDATRIDFSYWEEETSTRMAVPYSNGGVSAWKFEHQFLIKDSDRKLYLLISNIPNGPSGHKHYDYLGFILYLNGREFLIESGRETYKWCAVRAHDKAACAHNTYEIRPVIYWEELNAWKTNQSIDVLPNEVSGDGKKLSFRMGICLGEEQVKAYRTITYNPETGIRITDVIEGNPFEQYDAYFNLAEDMQVLRSESGFELRNHETSMFYSSEGVGMTYIVNGRASRTYNQGFDHLTLHSSGSVREVTHYLLFEKK